MVKLTGKRATTIQVNDPDAISKALAGVAELGREIEARKRRQEPEAKKKKDSEWRKWTPEDVLPRLNIIISETPGEAAVLKFIAANLDILKKEAPDHKQNGGTPWDYIVGSLENEIDDGNVDWAQYASEDDHEQPIIEVSQDEVKKALKAMLSKRSQTIAALYDKHDELNKKWFKGKLAVPLITFEKMSNRTLGNYTYGTNNIPIENHIRFNNNFIALQLADDNIERIFETLLHEMIHQWQDQIIYAKTDADHFDVIEVAQRNPDNPDDIIYVEAFQKKRPKQWHNKDFKEMAAVVGIPAKGPKCTGNPARMPEPKSYNRKFMCGCIASNGHPVTVYSTRPVDATCNVCVRAGRSGKFIEVPKTTFKGTTIAVNTSHVELPGQDAVHDLMKQKKFAQFDRFKTKGEKDAFVAQMESGEADEQVMTDMQEGVYQKNHNAYKDGYRYWVAYNVSNPDKITPDDLPKAGKKPEEPKILTADGGKQRRGKILNFPKGEMEAPAAPPAQPERTYSADNPQDIIDVYKEAGSTRKVAGKLGIAQSTLMGRIRKFQIDFNAGTFITPES